VARENPYKPPAAPVADTGPPPQRSLTLAVLAGLAVSVGGTILSRVVVFIVYAALSLERGGTVEAISATFSSAFIAIVILGCIFSVLGGYVGARVARRHERRVALILAVLATAIAWSTITGDGAFAALLLTLTFASVMAGAGLGRYRNLAERRKAAGAMAA
jgi:MFS family permease